MVIVSENRRVLLLVNHHESLLVRLTIQYKLVLLLNQLSAGIWSHQVVIIRVVKECRNLILYYTTYVFVHRLVRRLRSRRAQLLLLRAGRIISVLSGIDRSLTIVVLRRLPWGDWRIATDARRASLSLGKDRLKIHPISRVSRPWYLLLTKKGPSLRFWTFLHIFDCKELRISFFI